MIRYLIAIVILALIPATLLWGLFTGSQADVGSQSMFGLPIQWNLGGPIAAFVVILLLLYFMAWKFNDMITPLPKRVLKKYLGDWYIAGSVPNEEGANTTVYGRCNIRTSNNRLQIAGKYYADRGGELAEYPWTADEIIVRENRLIYLFDAATVGGQPNVLGLTKIQPSGRARRAEEMVGTWSLAGQDGHGTIKFTRKAPAGFPTDI